MQITINNKKYDTDTMTPEAQGLVQGIVNCDTQMLAYKASKEFFTQNLIYLLESNAPIADESSSDE